MARATTGILVDLTDAGTAVAVADRLRRMGFRAAAHDESGIRRPVPPPRHPAVVVTEHDRADEHASARGTRGHGAHPDPAADRRVLVVDQVSTTASAADITAIATETARHADAVGAAPPPLEVLTTAELTAGIAPFRHDGGVETSFGAGKFAVVAIAVYEGSRIRRSFGPAAGADLERTLAQCVDDDLPGVYPVGVTEQHEIVLVVDRSRVGRLSRGLEMVVRRLAARHYRVGRGTVSEARTDDDRAHDTLQVTPLVGYAPFSSKDSARSALARALVGVQGSRERLDLEPTAGPPRLTDAEELAALREPLPAAAPVDETVGAWKALGGRLRAVTQQPTGRLWTQFAITLAVGVLLPYVLYVAAAHSGLDLTRFTYPLVVVAMIVTALAIVVESSLAADPTQPAPVPSGTAPPAASAIIAAYLPNESATIVDTIEAFRRIDYAGDLQIVLAYNTPQDLPVEAVLRDIAARDPRLTLLRVPASTSKAQNVNAALDVVRGEFVGIFDADHHPGPGSFERAWAWLRDGYDVVQGHCVVRNGSASHLAGIVAVEFESIYAVSHPGRAQLHGFGIFGGSNGYWRTSVLRETRMRRRMLTEDIDASIRSITAGHRVASDPRLTSYELATTTLGQLTAQRLRWAQGWLQVSAQHLAAALRSPHLTVRQKIGMTYLLGWRELYPWVSLQVYPILLFALLHPHRIESRSWFISLFVLSTVFTLAMGPLQAFMAYVLGEPSIRAHRRWYWRYLVWSGLFTELKSALTRIAHVKELSRERVWRVTPRVVPDAPDTHGTATPRDTPRPVGPEAQVA
ncbi:glycosyltransferase family 2 protein [Luteimicrobium subarcticum]|uniref:Cellulose synthase/poly-beta-1,6-N-acetylglucosamine synthase-like glycosyltransferase n=1 Tax=Luteimicrobium subarcticum TaxID=620910 RepID=A0A2M8WVK3_9MICO|nr:glycosyltransferase [Luteimicrobium subarcticum]PJI94943.1 cellulose synthase/poly-beta-1,6-N-acetylglucosamine synthase-like glycosyltransferase [Luteimicrobium subarcticum]